ncbi:hypothetical protein [Shimia abyssi]|uniref:Peptidase M23 n=1 Tax=Shimia abyssi TaxID=1662395 RepID=A0A2P8FHI3_9RHOB|nr:hypothetical protein [Shimia abyssi]PSL21191.1 hypothetical protein CLV88_102311 [Shimia abyssi]
MKHLLAPITVLLATPTLAHEGVHLHPHASDPSWLPLIVGTVVVATLGRLVWVRR